MIELFTVPSTCKDLLLNHDILINNSTQWKESNLIKIEKTGNGKKIKLSFYTNSLTNTFYLFKSFFYCGI